MSDNKPVFPTRRKHIVCIGACLLLGMCIFLLRPGAVLLETSLFLPVDIENMPSGLTLSAPPEKGIDVRIRGPKSIVETLSDRKLRYPLDLSGRQIGVQSISIDAERMALPKHIDIIRIQPSYVTVKIEKEIDKIVPIVISVSGKTGAGFFVSDALSQPSSVVLRGPKSRLKPLDKIVTKPIDVSGAAESFRKEITLDLPEAIAPVSQSAVILAKIFIEKRIITKKFKAIPVKGIDCAYPYTITPEVIEIDVKGPMTIIDRLSTQNGIRVYVNLKSLKPGVYVRCASISLPLETTLIGVKPELFTVKILDG